MAINQRMKVDYQKGTLFNIMVSFGVAIEPEAKKVLPQISIYLA